jgi:hypothetical protein
MRYFEWLMLLGIIIGFIGIFFIMIFQTLESSIYFLIGINIILMSEMFGLKDENKELTQKLKDLEMKG